jgi:hypothetical protein
MLAFTSVYFFELGLFNGLQPIQTKKIPLVYLRLYMAFGLKVSRKVVLTI